MSSQDGTEKQEVQEEVCHCFTGRGDEDMDLCCGSDRSKRKEDYIQTYLKIQI